jgi:hypothetical protein
LASNDIWELYEEDPKLLPFGLFAIFGVGIQVYPMTPAIEKMKEINTSPDPEAAFEKLRKEDPILASKVKEAMNQETFTEFDWSLTFMGIENGVRAQFLVEHFKRLSKSDRDWLYNDLTEKKLISKKVAEQIANLEESESELEKIFFGQNELEKIFSK